MKLARFAGVFACAVALVTVVVTVLSLVLSARADELAGLARQVYPETGFAGAPVLDGISPDVDLGFLDEYPTLPRRFFSARWHGFWYLPKGAAVELHGAGDDHLDVRVDGALVIRRTPPTEMHTQVAALELGAGLHEIVVEYEQHGGMYNLRLEWAPQNGSPRPLPPHFLFHAPAEADDIQVVPRALALRTLVPIVWMTLVAAGLVWVATRITARYRIAATVVRSDPVDEAVVPNRLSVVLAGATYAFAVGMFLKNAWVTEDAYILFRSVEQVFAGNGPVWNLHERVQVFTSPLWFGLLVLSRILSADLYLNAVVLSFALWLFTLRNLQRLAPNSPAFAMSVLLCVASTAVHDYTSSGLENVLAYALITYFLLQTVRLHRDALEPPEVTRTLFHLCLAFGLISATRHDLVLLLLPPAAFAVWSHRRLMITAPSWFSLAAAAFVPLAAWTLFSLVYYGFPWPNTAYAKLNTGIARADLVLQGLRYLYAGMLQDAITLAIIGAALVVPSFSTRPAACRFVGAGIVLNLVYVVSVGGDFMLGRFLSYACLASVCLLTWNVSDMAVTLLVDRRHGVGPSCLAVPRRRWTLSGAAVTIVAVWAYAVVYPHTPVNCWSAKHEHVEQLYGIVSERDWYEDMTLVRRLTYSGEDGMWLDDSVASNMRNSPELVHVAGTIGRWGYLAGTRGIIVDCNALSDPLLARLPVRDPHKWRIGHFTRAVPDGYVERVTATQRIKDDPSAYGLSEQASETDHFDYAARMYPISSPELNEFYGKLAIVTQTGDLWSIERLRTIVLFNLGAYDRLADGSTYPEHAPAYQQLVNCGAY